jgi:hypothetical protein
MRPSSRAPRRLPTTPPRPPAPPLVGVPLAIGATGSSPPGDVIAGWRFALWTLPDVAITLLAVTSVALAVGVAKLIAAGPGHGRRATLLG